MIYKLTIYVFSYVESVDTDPVSEKVFRRNAYANVRSKFCSTLPEVFVMTLSLIMYLKKVEKNVDDNGVVLSSIVCFLYDILTSMSPSKPFVPSTFIGKFPHVAILVLESIVHCLNKNSEMWSEAIIPSIIIEAGNVYLPSWNVSCICSLVLEGGV